MAQVNFQKNPGDKLVKQLRKRFTAKTIARYSGFSEGQVTYRRGLLRQKEETLAYRQGRHPDAIKYLKQHCGQLIKQAQRMQLQVHRVVNRRVKQQRMNYNNGNGRWSLN